MNEKKLVIPQMVDSYSVGSFCEEEVLKSSKGEGAEKEIRGEGKR